MRKSKFKISPGRVIAVIGVCLCSVTGLLVVILFLAPLLKLSLHLDFSQSWRKVDGAEQIIFWDNWKNKGYGRTFYGLRVSGKTEKPSEEKKTIDWLDNKEYAVSASGEYVAWYDWENDQIQLCEEDGAVISSFDIAYSVNHIVFSPKENYILYCEIEYGGEMTDDETCYYNVIEIESGEVYPIYSGYREWFDLFWE